MIAAGIRTVTRSYWFLLLFLFGCQTSWQLEPQIFYDAPKPFIENLPSPFPPLTPKEYSQDWGKELVIAKTFAREFDFYRAITSYKRALILIPPRVVDRNLEIEYGIILSYYLGRKHKEAIDAFECGRLANVSSSFPAYNDLLILLYDSYIQINEIEKANSIFSLIELNQAELSKRLSQYQAIKKADFISMSQCKNEHADLCQFLDFYESQSKSVRTAQFLNAILPGAGYLYVGQKQTALTSFLLNSLFTAAAYHFFHQKNIAAGLILSSFEFGWYVGGINGAGLAAREYNERLFECNAKEFMLCHQLFPILMFQYSF